MQTPFRLRCDVHALTVGFLVAAASATPALAAGIPEPDIIMYGLVTNVRDGANIRLGHGQLTCTLQPATGLPIVVTATLTNYFDELSYILRVPCETEVAGFAASSNVVKLTAGGMVVNRAQISWNGVPVTFVNPAQTNTTISVQDRGRIERVDLVVSAPLTDSDGDGLPDDWELTYFGNLAQGPNGDADGDGITNLAEYQGGTNPIVPAVPLQFVGIRQDLSGGLVLSWTSSSNKLYTLQRSSNLATGFADVVINIPATPRTNVYRDANANGAGSVFLSGQEPTLILKAKVCYRDSKSASR